MAGPMRHDSSCVVHACMGAGQGRACCWWLRRARAERSVQVYSGRLPGLAIVYRRRPCTGSCWMAWMVGLASSTMARACICCSAVRMPPVECLHHGIISSLQAGDKLGARSARPTRKLGSHHSHTSRLRLLRLLIGPCAECRVSCGGSLTVRFAAATLNQHSDQGALEWAEAVMTSPCMPRCTPSHLVTDR